MRWARFTLAAGVILPALSILVECTTHICAGNFFDPIPTIWHVLLVVFVPIAHLQVWRAIRQRQCERAKLLSVTNAIAIGISLFYTLVYIPLLPLAAVALVFFGLGILPLAPLFALIAGLVLRRQLVQRYPATTKKGFWLTNGGLLAGIAISFCFIALAELPSTITRYGLQMAASQDLSRKARGIRLLRNYGDKEALLRACYYRTGSATDLIGYLFSVHNPVPPGVARETYYRVTGQSFDLAPPPTRFDTIWLDLNGVNFDRDRNDAIRRNQLVLHASQLDGSADADAGLAYIEWTLAFKNDSTIQQEARGEVQLPPGAVVSRLALWLDGRWSEAAFAARSRTQQAYQLVVAQKRDPVLVTTSGRDRVRVQCFPVEPNGGEMKVRLGITTPLFVENLGYERLLLPRFVDRNFGITDDFKHAVWIESNGLLESQNTALAFEPPLTSLHALRGSITDQELSWPQSSIRFARSGIKEAWTRSTVNGKSSIVRQNIEERTSTPARRIILVVDTSRRMRDSALEIASSVLGLPSGTDLRLLFAGGNGVYGSPQEIKTGNLAYMAQTIGSEWNYEGGADNVPALITAWDMAAGDWNVDSIIWIHSPQPVQLQAVNDLRQRLERRPNGPPIYSVQTIGGYDRILSELDGIAAVKSVPRFDHLNADLNNLFAQQMGQQHAFEYVRSNEINEATPDAVDAKETSSHLARLWANEEVNRMLASNDRKAVDEATQLALQYQLVTPVTGAVVLETQEQYRAAGLQPVAPGTVPTIPEPEIVLLIAVVVSILLFGLYFRAVIGRKRPRFTP
jgi:hypothetical protein